MYTQGSPDEMQDQQRRRKFAPLSVIAQQYLSATFTSKGFHSRTENFDAPFKNSVFSIFFLFLKIS
jgi:hypothetical protein